MKKILVANRAEIALRVMRTAKRMGISTVAVYSEADRKAPHVKFADEAYLLGPAPSSESYLNIEKIIDVAKESNADGIHPGYGFLSENSAFAEAVTKAGIKFIGPSPESIEIMGSKLAAKEAVGKFDIPLVPGTDKPLTDPAKGKQKSEEIGYPVLIKASAGGGGKGMRAVYSSDEFDEALNLAQCEAKSAFGDESVFIEKYIQSPRHIEIQVLFDEQGNGVYLFDRECSVQRRHQKVIEEAPSPKVNQALRKEMGETALKVAKSCGYFGAGTVEFIMDASNNYYFLEMNTRLQVEHPVSELITGVDLVEEQIKVARGEALSFSQEDLRIDGHSIELRVYAENAYENFSPSIGTLNRYDLPEGKGIRVDDGLEEGMEIPIYYDPMISKLIVHAPSRSAAILLMRKAINNYIIDGVENTLSFGDFVMSHPSFIDGSYDTNFIREHMDEFLNDEHQTETYNIAAHAVLKHWKDYSNKLRVVE